MICPHCGTEIPDYSNFCTACGTPLFAPAYRYKLNLNKLLGDTFTFYKRHFGTLCLVGICLFFPPFICAMGVQMFSTAGNVAVRTNAPDSLILLFSGLRISMQILQIFIQWYVVLGAIRQCLYIARGGIGFQMDYMFPPLVMFLKVIGLQFVLASISLITLLASLPLIIVFISAYTAGAFAGNGPSGEMIAALAACGLFAFAGGCVAFWCSIRLFLAQFFIADRNAGITDSLTEGWRVSSGNFWRLFAANLVLGTCAILGIFLCCIGSILTIAFPTLGGVLIYLQLTGQPNCLDYPPRLEVQP